MATTSSARLLAVISSGCLNKRSRLTDLADNVSIPSRANLMELTEQDENLLSIFNLQFLSASLFATVLEDTITEIRILDECNNKLRQMKTIADISVLLARKFDIAQPSVPDELAGIDPKNLRKEEYKLDKLAADRKYIYDTLLVTYLDLSLNKSFEGLAQEISDFVEMNLYRQNLIEEEAKNRATRRELAKQLRVQRNHMTSANYDVDIVIEGLRNQVEDANLHAETRGRYTASWELARTEQHNQWILDREVPTLASIVSTKQKLDTEHRVHSEAMLLITLIINETMEKVENMMSKYDEDIEAIDLRIQIMKNNYQSEFDRRIELEEMYAKHEKECAEWKDFKLEREKARQYADKMTKAAIVAQAWWRGILVRLQLGPYKPKRKPGFKPIK